MTDLAEVIRERLREAADPRRAPGQQAYMKSAMPFLGVGVPEVRRLTRREVAAVSDAALLRDTAQELWDAASYREERYAALAVLASRSLRGDPAVPDMIEHMVRTGRWWDFTDELAHRLADMLDDDPLHASALVREWAQDEDFWMRRIAIIAQLGRRDRVDTALLTDAILPNIADTGFFIRKAIGWALREYARVAPEWVRAFVDAHPLSPLSRREALKHLG